MAEWIKMPLGMKVGLGPVNIVLDGHPAPPPLNPLSFLPMSIVAKRSSQLLLSTCLNLFLGYCIREVTLREQCTS